MVVHLFNLRPDHVKIVSNTVGAIADSVGYGPAACVTVIACSHVAGCPAFSGIFASLQLALVAGFWILVAG